ncbi:Alpha/beta hydrolase fold-1 [Macleaya cordata]|uniref:soluble epoxide hydrolase n=1 Tax=Macleaya cordata TaxID=56857 RepID=A0A200Q6S5_MACCD|nr:Alpha/beta hydrolase fold-1 [Macleaya cordata]
MMMEGDHEEVKQRRIQTNGIWMHIAEKGRGSPNLVLLLHGFPELWFSWRHQINHLANSGYHVVAPDLRGYGDTDSPPHHTSYTVLHLVGDLIGLLDHLDHQQAFVVGHDWGAVAAWHLSLFRPDRVRGVVSLSVPFWPPTPPSKPLEFFKQMFGDGFYITQFQEPGRAEKAFAHYDHYTVMKKFLLINSTDLLIAPPGMEIVDHLQTPLSLPPWITEEELQFYADKFAKSGYTGGFNYYRAMDLNWELLAPWQGSKITVPAKFIVGDKDIGFESVGSTKDYIEGEVFKSLVPNLEVVIINNGHHFIQQEKAQEVTDEILSFLSKHSVA